MLKGKLMFKHIVENKVPRPAQQVHLLHKLSARIALMFVHRVGNFGHMVYPIIYTSFPPQNLKLGLSVIIHI